MRRPRFGTGARPRRAWLALMAGLFFLLAAGPAAADTYTYYFMNITNNNAANAAAGEAQLRMDVSGSDGSNVVYFKFYHDGNTSMSITDIYFYDGVLGLSGTTLAIFAQSLGVSFDLNATPAALPGGSGYGLPTSSVVFSSDSNPPVAANGIQPPSEYLTLKFTLAAGKDIDDVVAALAWIQPGESPPLFDPGTDLVVGLHVQAFANGGSESFVVRPPGVPLPGSVLLFGSGLLGLLAVRRRLRSRR